MLRVRPVITAGASRATLRVFSSSCRTHAPVPLAADVYAAPTASASSSAAPLVILHGLYGSKQNWRSLAKSLAQKLERDVHALDLRNHGTSPHAPEVSYTDLAGDVGAYIQNQKLDDVVLMGHSMGGKVAMSLTLEPCEAVKKLIIVDMAPAVGAISPEFKQYLETMRSVDQAGIKTRKEADEILQAVEPDFGVRAFLLTNLIPSPTAPGTLKFRLPLDYFALAIEEIGGFPFAPGERAWSEPALFVKGAKSKYINRRNIPVIEQYFPKARVETLDAGHWVHAEKPKEFVQLVHDFCNEK